MNYKEFLPSNHLTEVIHSYWFFEVLENEELSFPIQHETLPENSTSIVLIKQPYFSGVRILGPRNKKFHQSILPNSIFLGIRIHPWLTTTPILFDKKDIINETIEASTWIKKHLPIEDLIQFTTSHLNLEKKLSQLFNNVKFTQDDLVKFICLELSNGAPIQKIVNNMPYSIRVIQKRFKSIVGLTMRQYSSNIKQRKIWEDLLENKKDKIELIYKYNYYDQSHFINEFKRKMNRSVSDYETYLRKIDITLI